MFIWMAKFGAAYGVRTGIHVGVDVFVNLLGPTSRKRVIVFGLLCGALFTATVAVFGGAFVWKVYHTGIRSNDLEVRMWIVFSAIPLGSGLMCFRFLQVAWWFYWTGQLPHHDASHVEGVEEDNLHPEPVGGECRQGRFDAARPDHHSRPAPDRGHLLRAKGRSHRAAAGHARVHSVRPADRADVHRHAGIDLRSA